MPLDLPSPDDAVGSESDFPAQRSRLRCRRLLVLWLIPLLMAAGVARIWFFQGLFIPMRVTESSMAPHLKGEHAVVICPACQRPFATELYDPTATDLRVVCPRCGTLHELSQPVSCEPGERVLIKKWKRHRPENLRWDVVAVAHPTDGQDWLVKRLVGLPGERIQLRDGDVYVNGRVLAKSLSLFRSLAIPVLDTQGIRPNESTAAWSRWLPRSVSSAWMLGDNGYVADSVIEDGWSWLSFQGCDVVGRRPPSMLLLDDYTFNQSLSRPLHPVCDFLLRCDVYQFRLGRVACRVTIDGKSAQVTWDPSSRLVELNFEGRILLRRRLTRAHVAPRVEMEFAICDGRVHFALDRKSVLTSPLPSDWKMAGRSVEQLQLGADRARLTLRRIELFRDIFYLPSVSPGTELHSAEVTIGPTQLYVLGDNSPISEDSRRLGPICLGNLLGVVVATSPKQP